MLLLPLHRIAIAQPQTMDELALALDTEIEKGHVNTMALIEFQLRCWRMRERFDKSADDNLAMCL